jgi:hypothetical protein
MLRDIKLATMVTTAALLGAPTDTRGARRRLKVALIAAFLVAPIVSRWRSRRQRGPLMTWWEVH